MKFSITSCVALFAAFTAAMPTSPPMDTDASLALRDLQGRAVCTRATTDSLLFKYTMSAFQARRRAKNPSQCIWTSDNCSKSPDRLPGVDFRPSCQRHDFGYRNTKKQKRFTSAMKKRIDDNFKKDLYAHCATKKGLKGTYCRRLADVYYKAVRKFGKRDLVFDVEKMEFKRAEPFNETVAEVSDFGDDFENFDGEELDPDNGEEEADLDFDEDEEEVFDEEDEDVEVEDAE
ncbi:prokaryotic phospholipase A2-domain-containing protein [Paramyrothecium foliicola]|nr:prokaryotic phospholipase A2-domain-containing protein [Paramyrothecium foliicola]